MRDPAGRTLKTVAHEEPTSGADVRLTLDETIQYAAEDVLRNTLRTSGAKQAVAIVMDPRSGEILAMANAPALKGDVFNADAAVKRNRCITDVYEPGSIFKLVTISGALADGTVTTKSKFTLPPSLTLYDRTINESHPRGTVTYSVREVLQWSSNVGAVTIGMKMGRDALLKWMDKFGFGEPTGLGLPGEAGGIVPPGRAVVGHVHRQHPHGTGHRRDAAADGGGVLDGRQQRRAGHAAPRGPGRRHDQRRGEEAARHPRQGRA